MRQPCNTCDYSDLDKTAQPCVACYEKWINTGYHTFWIKKSALTKQVAGNHYKELKIQPVEFIHKNEIGFMAGNVIKYVCRYKAKNGVQDLEKAKHYIEMLIEQETKESKHD